MDRLRLVVRINDAYAPAVFHSHLFTLFTESRACRDGQQVVMRMAR